MTQHDTEKISPGFDPRRERFHYPTDRIMEKPFDWKIMARLLRYVRPYAFTLLPLAIVAMLVGTLVRLAVPLLIATVIDETLLGRDLYFLWTLTAVILAMYLISWLANVWRIRWTNQLGQNVIYDLRRRLFSHIQHLSHRFFGQRSAGSILVRITNDINALQELFTNGIINLLMDIIMLTGIVIILFVLSPELTLAIMVVLPLMFFLSTGLRRRIRRAWQQVRLKQSRLNSHLNESIQGIRVTQAYTQEEENTRFFMRMNRDNLYGWQEAVQKSALFRPLVEMSGALGTAILIWYGVQLIATEVITIGVFVAFAYYLGQFWEPISRLGQMYNQLLVAMASSERIFEFMDEQPSVAEKPDAIELKEVQGEIVLERVSFSYDGKREVLKEISLRIPAGQTVALVGHTGSGKSTIVNLIARFYDPTRGRIFLDGHDLKEVQLASLRRQISIVLQDTFIFSGTIMDNIRFGRPSASDEEVIAAARAVGADQFIQRLKHGYQTEVEERGSVLSVGQRQLLSFARALLADPKILILDEATASIDTETEVKIQQALRQLLQGRTAIIIAHRLSTIRDADQIVVLENGQIKEQGNHDQLMNRRGHYYSLVRSQYEALLEA
ncbi:putative ABC transporter ATP-binding protein YknV [Caldalkalibacillus thermarum]|uniref:ABC transporter ATP-binding protein n=1 Tax=Caldalkalibacillus thermarum TaxID=296745 RepID=UPI001665E24E|nr:ABC transporter ATP-binding protein [Caldalkalibacillus thermarum]GGK29908.1 putative ABC transporter ATP-binding protein YknV [Caldalkalibacillus thermarum]